ncbi:hypothetical protein C7293_16505 [filamentous cyanobacterium CCT1]|nr:hypothetical protein C7293_16505 [filamentous cyanobacterium CCT1]PSN81328.1 hypothetical protein C8B47_01895 [filamentous cyanobacterium CCP4]
MKIERNVKGLRESAKRKRDQALEKVEAGIKKLVKEQRPINFNTVAEASAVSKAWLYKQPEVRQRIEYLRSQPGSRQKPPPKHRASDESLKAIIQTLKSRVKRLEEKNRDLTQQNQVAYGQVLRVRELERQLARLEEENQRLCERPDLGISKLTAKGSLPILKILGVEMNSTLARLIDETPEGIVSTAIKTLQEAIPTGKVLNPGGFLNKAITDAWKPNGKYLKSSQMDDFNAWWKWAHGQGLVKAATQIDGAQHVLTAHEEWIPFDEAVKKHPHSINA